MNGFENSLYLADAIDLLRDWYSKGHTNFIDLIYIDPPFNSNRNYNVLFDSDLSEEAFKDTWSSVSYLDELEGIASMSPNLYNFLKMLETTGLPKSYISYLTKMSIRCWYMREMLKDTGSFYYHCDPTMSHYIKVMLDYIFGLKNFKNEIIWQYFMGGKPKTFWPRKHDDILFYTKTKSYTFNQIRIKRYLDFKPSLKDDSKNAQMGKDEVGYWSLVACPDVWPIKGVFNMSNEWLSYPTQKVEKLLERIILASSNEGDLVADFFMGGGTTIAVAEKLGRKWLGADINNRAIQITEERIEKLHKTLKKDFFIYGIPRSSKELRKMVDDNILGKEKNSRFALEDVICKYYLNNVVGNEKKVGDHSIDGRFIFSFNNITRTGLVQVTSGAGINHFKSFCLEVIKLPDGIGVYICFKDRITSGMYREAKLHGKVGHVDKIQILTIEDLVDNGKQFEVPMDIVTT